MSKPRRWGIRHTQPIQVPIEAVDQKATLPHLFFSSAFRENSGQVAVSH